MTTQSNEETLAKQAKELSDQALEFDNKGDYQQALQLWKEIVDLCKQFPLDNPQYKNNLAVSYQKCGVALGDLRRFEEAIEYFQHALDLFKQFPLDNLGYGNQLANMYCNCGLTLYNSRRFEEAIVYYQHAIDLFKQFPLDNPEYKNDLSLAYNNCGLALYNLRKFEEAIAYLQRAIELRTQLPLDNPEYRNNLLGAYVNFGSDLVRLRKFEESLHYYRQAIKLGKKLPLENNPLYASWLSNAYSGCGVALGGLRRFEEAEEMIKESLKILKELEERGVFWHRQDRERYFENAIAIYFNGRSFHFVPELILEHLDPDNNGSAPQSEKMHEVALKGLLRLYQKVYYTHPELIKEIEETIEKLAEIRAKYFTGTAEGANLTAQFYEEKVSDLNKAEQILKHYVEKVPSDPVGYQQVGEFYERHQRYSQALTYFENSIKIALQQNYEKNFIFNTLKVTSYLAIENKEFPDFMAFNAAGIAFKQLNQIKDWFNGFVDSFEKTEKTTLKDFWKSISDDLDNEYQQWLAGYHSNVKQTIEKELKEQFKQKREAQRRILNQIIRSLEKTLVVIVETLFNNFEEQWEQYDVKWESSNSEQRQVIESEIIHTLQNVVERLSQQLSEEEKRFAFKELQQDLPLDLWTILEKNEQDILLLAMRMKQKEIYQLASLSFGQFVEIILLKRLFQPLKHYLQQNNLKVHSTNPKDTVAYFFNGKLNYLMLGSMVGAFNQLVHKTEKVTSEDVEKRLLNELKKLPKNDLLLKQSNEVYQTRAEQLQRITKIRNNSVHLGKTSLEESNEIYDNVIKDSQHAFCRYFIGAF